MKTEERKIKNFRKRQVLAQTLWIKVMKKIDYIKLERR